jgi:5-methyltetrahydropteroyltriglutamate--homocysteine methyltransferase
MESFTSRPPFRADHIGSLLRPPRVRNAFRDFHAGTLAEAEFRSVQDSCIRDIVRVQEDLGFQVVTDGEYRRSSYWGRFVERTEGLGLKPAIYRFHDDQGGELDFIAPQVEGKVRRTQAIAVDEVQFTASITNRATKITLPAPSTMHFWRGRDYAEPGVYSSPEEFFADLGRVYQAEIEECARAGAKYVQLDEVALVMLCDEATREKVRSQGQSPEDLVRLYIGAINQAVANRPENLVVGVHVCRGNFKGKHLAEGGYDSIAEELFANTNVDHFLLEYDTPRAGDFAPLRFLPKNKGVVLGLISTKTGHLESLDDLLRKIDEAAHQAPLAQLGVSPQCGFASTVAGNPLSAEEMRAKLKLVVDCARAVWG